MVKPLTFKGEKKPRKRKHRDEDDNNNNNYINPSDDRRGKSSSTTITAQEQVPSASATTDETPDDQSWVSADTATDINGPVIFVLPSTPPTCMACDANGKVFASELENMIDGDPSTAEPHDVRQVWVAMKVAGSEGFSFKGHHGKYLSCDKYGILSATASAISHFESFLAIQAPDTPGMISFATRGGEKSSDGDDSETFLTIKENNKISTVEIRGDATSISFNTTLRVRLQARFKPKLKASKETRAREKISRKELEAVVGRRLEDHEVKRLKRARKEGNFHEEVLDVRVKGKHDKFAS